ncbi:pirin family protein [Azoarcus olearius]|uniref:Probable pirin-related protein n=1 Tax=Azoarcus sp. (strain BH72) TaxID=418699 RepID=A1K1M3_AZOSB|nr:pirin family protein [Azoarcus olearius]ANQ83203.1 pirin-related protein [Azoarcus olearius]CAL92728.1 probable pirin-related protein [Azoarcus olearius]
MPELLIEPRRADLGHGLVVQRILPYARRRMVGPFIFLDHAGPVRLPPELARLADVRPHPHIGLATVSYLLGGEITHRDSLGMEQPIRPGEVNWMTAGRGIVHSERFDSPAAFAGTGLELLQSWVALPAEHEETAPAFDHYPAALLPTATEGGLWLRVIAGKAFGLASPVRTLSPMFYLHVKLTAGSAVALPGDYSERAAYVVDGRIEIDGTAYGAGRMLVFGQAEAPTLRALDDATVMLLGGEPVGERHIWWNFVSSRKDRIEQAKADWRAGRIPLPPNDNAEFIPLPETVA